MAGWAQAALLAWAGLGVGGSAPAPEAPALVEVTLSKPKSQPVAWNGHGDVAASRRPWGAAPGWCHVSMVEGAGAMTAAARSGTVSESAMEFFLLAHEMGHCADRRAPEPLWRSEEQDGRREAFADAFAGCAMAQEGLGAQARKIARARVDGARSERSRRQSRALLAGVSNPSCSPGSGMAAAVAAAAKAEGEAFGSLAPQLPAVSAVAKQAALPAPRQEEPAEVWLFVDN